jgi:uncharacterized Fe-S cluster protein YjdI/CDGSH-type Zn-finger protein
MEKKYTNGEITVVWNHKDCIHSTNCFKGLSQVFDPRERPWVNMEGADSERIMKQIDLCPSGALSYYKNSEGPKEKVKPVQREGSIVAETHPAQVLLEEGKSYLWCACGKSVDQPFCDMTHKKGSDQLPLVVKPIKTDDVWLCQCKQTKNPPYCDGTHNTL